MQTQSTLKTNDQTPQIGVEKYAVSIVSNFAKAFDKYSMRYSKQLLPARFPNQFFVLDKDQLHIGIEKNQALLLKNGNPHDQLLILRSFVEAPLHNDHATGIGHYIKQNYLVVSDVYLWQDDSLQHTEIEDVSALSLQLQSLAPYEELVPRSVSVLPVARGCQADCAFCFSKASVSSERNGFHKQLDQIDTQLAYAKQRGASRAVITGGGEATLLKRETLLALIERSHAHFEKTVLISNAYVFSELSSGERREFFSKLAEAGLSILAMSHHHWDPAVNKNIMKLDIKMQDICTDLHQMQIAIQPRLICVLQKGGVENASDIAAYLSFAARLDVEQVCFKELYVSTSVESYYHNHQANQWSRHHQISLSVLTQYLEWQGFEIVDRLPWGAPIYAGTVDNKPMRIAAYTEPSLFWERSNGLVRSWNIMSDGKMLASLEDAESEIHL